MEFKFSYNKQEAAKLLADENTSAFVLMVILLDAYKDAKVMEQLSAVIFADLEDDFGCRIPPENENKINAGITCMTTDMAYRMPHVFQAVALAFNDGHIGDIPDGEEEEVSALEALWAMHVIGLLNNDDMSDPDKLYGPLVLAYLQRIIREEAYDNEQVDDSVDTVEEALDEPYFMKYIKLNIKETAEQLARLECKPQIIRELLDMYDLGEQTA